MLGIDSSIFSKKVLRNLVIHRLITHIAQGFVVGFGAIFFYFVSGEQLLVPLFLYLFAAIGGAVSLFFADKTFNVIGVKQSIILGIVFRILLWITLVLTTEQTWTYTIPIYTVMIVAIRFFYWPVYNNVLSNNLTVGSRTQVIGLMRNIRTMVGIFMPTVVGIIITLYSFNTAFILGTILIILSIIPVIRISDMKDAQYEWSAQDLFNKFTSSRNRSYVFGLAAHGFESAYATALWPIVIYLLLDGNFISIGVIASLAGVAVVGINYFTSRIADRMENNGKFLKWGTTAQSVVWVLRVFAESAMDIFLLRTFSQASSSVIAINQESLSFGHAKEHKQLNDEYVVLREFAMNTGRVVAYSSMIFLSFYLELQFLFILAAIAVLLTNVLSATKKATHASTL